MNLLSIINPTKSEFESTVQEILRRPEYRHLRNFMKDFIDSIKEKIAEWILKILEKTTMKLSNSISISDKVSTIFMIMGLVIIAAIIIFIIIRINKTFERRSRVKEILGEKIDHRTTPLSLKNKAQDFRLQGDYRQAIRYDFIALLLLMHEGGMLYLDETKTNEEIYLFLKKKAFSQLQLFQYLKDVFNSTWYGHKNCDDLSYTKWNETYNLLWDEVINGEKKKNQ